MGRTWEFLDETSWARIRDANRDNIDTLNNLLEFAEREGGSISNALLVCFVELAAVAGQNCIEDQGLDTFLCKLKHERREQYKTAMKQLATILDR